MGKEIDAVVLAGGLGVRMGELATETQKCMLSVDGQPILTYILDNLQQAFGSAHLIIATGYKSETVREAYGGRYGNIDITYVYNPEHLETKRRLLLAEDLLHGPFLYLAGDVISKPDQLIKVAESYERDKGDNFLGSISVAIDHRPALSHAIITVQNGYAIEMIYPPTPTWQEGQVREMGTAYYDRQFLYRLKNSRPDQTYKSHVISEVIRQGSDFAVEKYFGKWFHFMKPEDLETTISF